MKSFKIHICDDHQLITESLVYMLESELFIERISVSRTAGALFESLRKELPEVIILDINVNKVNMLERIKDIRLIHPDCKIIILSAYDSPGIIRKAIQEKVDAYLFKTAPREEILEALHAVWTGKVYVSGAPKKNQSEFDDPFQLIESLSEREKEVIRCLVKGYPNKKISDELHISITTVQTHRRNIYRKLNLRGVGELVSFALNNQI